MISQPPAYQAASPAIAMPQAASRTIGRNILLVVGAGLLVAVCARFGTFPLPFTPVPFSLQNFAVLLIGLTLGSRRGALALVLYLAQGAAGLPVFAPTGPGGLAQLLGPTGGYLLAYPAVAFLAGWLFEKSRNSPAGAFAAAVAGATAGEMLLFASGITWLKVAAHLSFAQAAGFAAYPFFAGEALKVTIAAGLASKQRVFRSRPDENQ